MKNLPIRKILVDFLAWSLWVTAVVFLFSTLYVGTESGELYDLTDTAPIKYAAFFATFALLAVSAIVAFWISKKIE